MARYYKFDRVRVACKLADEYGNPEYIGKAGSVMKVFRWGAGIGESGTDPFYVIRFDNGQIDGYWGEELILLRGQRRK